MTGHLYLDYNATSPLAENVKKHLAKGDVDLKNPSSAHFSGRKARQLVNAARKVIASHFSLQGFQLYFHSGASEGMSHLFFSWVQQALQNKKNPNIIYFASDHPCCKNQMPFLQSMGAKTLKLRPLENGDFPYKEVQETIANILSQDPKAEVCLSFLWCNNETGVVWPLHLASKIKEQTNCFVIVDAVQSPGKVLSYKEADPSLDGYVYSAHKFGALKGIGFSFISPRHNLKALIKGGAQQSGLRAGTENVLGIHSIALALEELSQVDMNQTIKLKNSWEKAIEKRFGDKLMIVAKTASDRNTQTTGVLFKGKKADFLVSFFDMNHYEVSSGSACSSGSHLPSENLLALGLDEYANSSIRFSFSFNGEEYLDHGTQLIDLFSQLV